MTDAQRHAAAEDLGWKSCGACVLDDCCREIAPIASRRGVVRCTRPAGHVEEQHVACFTTTHRAIVWRKKAGA